MSTLKAIRDFFNQELSYNKEVACFLDGDRKILSLSTSNNPSAVAFDWDSIWEKIKSLEVYPNEFSMIHTHPPGMENMSSTDRNMVHGWVQGLGRPIWFAIICEDKCHLYLCDKFEKKVRIQDLGFGDIGDGVPYGGMLQMVMRGISQSNECFNLDEIVLELNSTFNKNPTEKQIPVWSEDHMARLANLGLLLREVRELNQKAGVCERIIWCQTLADSLAPENPEDESFIRFLNDKAWGL